MVILVGLPLLIVGGKFHSLQSLTVDDLETFIPFMTKCSVNRACAQILNGVPEWWASIIRYKFPLRRPSGLSEIGYHKHLCSIVCRCYWYHNVQYLLPFSAKMAENPDSVYLKPNDDNTTSIFYKHNNVHIMRFSNENINYDMKPKKNEKHVRRCLLPSLSQRTIAIPDIYLCDNCDAEFSLHSEMQEHEKECYEIVIDDDDDEEGDKVNKNYEKDFTGRVSASVSEVCGDKEDSSDSSEEIEILEHIKPRTKLEIQKNEILNYLGLKIRGSTMLTMKSKCKGSISIKKYYKINRNIEFSSTLGRQTLADVYKIAKDNINENKQLKTLPYESFCGTSIKNLKNNKDVTDYKISWRKGKKRSWNHHYTFGKRQRFEKYKQLKRGKQNI